MSAYTPLHALVSNVIGGSLLVQHAQALGIDSELISDPTSSETLDIYRKLTTTLGLNFDVTASHVLGSVTALLIENEIKEHNVRHIAACLWVVLGDPSRNGKNPPPIYYEAANAMYAWTLTLLHPTFIKH